MHDTMAGLPPFSTSNEAAPDLADLLAHDAPAITPAMGADLARDIYGVTGDIRPLSAEKDANFHIRLGNGEEALLKVTNAVEDRGVTHMQTAALMHLAATDPTLPVQRVCQTLTGTSSAIVTGPNGDAHVVRLMSYLDGTILSNATPGPRLYAALGGLLARLTLGLRGFFHPSAGHVLQWDIKQAHRLRPMLDAIEDDDLRRRLTATIDRFDADIAPRLPHLRAQVVHNDFNPHNLLVDGAQATRATGIIDFGDMVHTPVACDLAVACSYQISEGDTPLERIVQLIQGYSAALPLEDQELELLPDLMRLRHATTLTIGAWRARRYPENAAYILRNTAASLRGMDALDRIGTDAAIETLHRATQTE
ncbi:phosphotransferase [Roseovarius sp. Pro17]|uniref:phosphotransferase n=1 Tax=Roseovarius sp. Pro17 TaxID=3108175 RepID=UPI002D7996DE|nr:phosphotransferase [Roseovarius sp. Pro17]